MILRALTLKNFKQYTDFHLDFKMGLAGIVGKNGAGKSSIFEAILLCLYGLKSKQKEFIKSSWAGKKDHVSLTLLFEQGGKIYKIAREFRGKDLQHFANIYDHNEQLIATSDKEVSKTVAKLLGMDMEAFTHSIFTGQKELGQISRARKEERLKLIRRMVGLEKLDKIQQLVRTDRNELKSQITGMENLLLDKADIESKSELIKTKQKEITDTNKTYQTLEKTFKTFQKIYLASKKTYETQRLLQGKHLAIKEEMDKYINGLKVREEQYDEAVAQLKDLEEKQDMLKDLAPKAKLHEAGQSKIEILVGQEQQYNHKQKLDQEKKHKLDNLKEKKDSLKVLSAALKELPKLEKQAKDLSKTIEAKEALLEKLSKEREQFKQKTDVLQGKIEDRTEQISTIQSIGKDADCPTCLQPLVNSYDQTLAKLKKEIEQYEEKELLKLKESIVKIEKQIAETKPTIKENQLNYNNISAQLKALQQKKNLEKEVEQIISKHNDEIAKTDEQIVKIGTITFNPDELAQLRKEQSSFQEKYMDIKKLENEVEKIPDVKKKILDITNRIRKGKDLISEKDGLLKAVNFSQENFDATFAKQEKDEDLRDRAQIKLTEQKEALIHLQSEVDKIKNELDKNAANQKQIKATIENQQLLNELDGIFGSFKTNILERIRPVIANTASTLFKKVTKGRYEAIFVDKHFEFHIYDNGIAYPLHRFSGGETDLANLCLRIGISKAIAEISGTEEIGFLGFDEIFGSQDDDRRDQIMQALDMLKEQYRQIYIISHITSVKEEFPSVLDVRNGGNGSIGVWI